MGGMGWERIKGKEEHLKRIKKHPKGMIFLFFNDKRKLENKIWEDSSLFGDFNKEYLESFGLWHKP